MGKGLPSWKPCSHLHPWPQRLQGLGKVQSAYQNPEFPTPEVFTEKYRLSWGCHFINVLSVVIQPRHRPRGETEGLIGHVATETSQVFLQPVWLHLHGLPKGSTVGKRKVPSVASRTPYPSSGVRSPGSWESSRCSLLSAVSSLVVYRTTLGWPQGATLSRFFNQKQSMSNYI